MGLEALVAGRVLSVADGSFVEVVLTPELGVPDATVELEDGVIELLWGIKSPRAVIRLSQLLYKRDR